MNDQRYSLHLNDGGRSESKRPAQTADCTVRALSIVTGVCYDIAYETLAAAGRRPCHGFEIEEWLTKRRGKVFGGRFKRVSLIAPRAIPGSPKVIFTPSSFARYHSKGRFILSTPSHVFALLDGVAHDLWRIKDAPLADAWEWHPTP
jgi:hypothetical protein